MKWKKIKPTKTYKIPHSLGGYDCHVCGIGANKSSEILPHITNAYRGICVVPDLVHDKTESNFLAFHEDTNGEKKVGI